MINNNIRDPFLDLKPETVIEIKDDSGRILFHRSQLWAMDLEPINRLGKMYFKEVNSDGSEKQGASWSERFPGIPQGDAGFEPAPYETDTEFKDRRNQLNYNFDFNHNELRIFDSGYDGEEKYYEDTKYFGVIPTYKDQIENLIELLRS